MPSNENTPLLVPENSVTESESVNENVRTIRLETSKSSSGYVGSMVLAVFMIAVSGAQEISVYVSDHQKYYVQIVNSSYILLAFGILIACWTKRIKQAKTEDDREIETVIALVIFWIFGACYDYLTIGCNLRCFQDWMKTGHMQRIEIIVDTFYHFIRPIYKFFLVLVYTLCMNSVFPAKRTVRYGLMFIFATNVSIWVELLFDEAVHHHSVFHQTYNSFNNHSGNDTDYCFGNNSGIDQAMSIGTRICVPSMVEFTILIVECVMHWFKHCESKVEVSENSTQRNMHKNMIAAHNGRSECCNFKFWLTDADCWSKILFSLTFPCSIGLNVLFCVFSYEASIQESFTSFQGDRYIYYSTAFWSLNIILTICTYLVSRRFVSSNLSFQNLIGIERLLLLSLIGPMLMAVFSFVSIFHEWYSIHFPNVKTPWKFLFQEGTNTLQILIQIPLIFYVRRIGSETFDSSVSQETILTLPVEISTPDSNNGDQEIIPRNTRQSNLIPHSIDERGFRTSGSYGATAHSINAGDESREMILAVNAIIHTQQTSSEPDRTSLQDSDKVSLPGTSCEGRLPESVESSISRDINAMDSSQVINTLSRNNPLVPIVNYHDHNHLIDNSAEVNQINTVDHMKEGENNANAENYCDNNEVVTVNVTNGLHCVTNWPKYVLLAATFHLLISNAMHWIVNNFVDPRYEKLTLVKAYFDPTYWPIVSSVLAPLSIFFRFHSMMLFIRAWRGLSFVKTTQDHSIDGAD